MTLAVLLMIALGDRHGSIDAAVLVHTYTTIVKICQNSSYNDIILPCFLREQHLQHQLSQSVVPHCLH